MTESKTKIIITRKSEWKNRLRAYSVLIDGAVAGSISNGSSEEYAVAPGEHKVQCKLSWYSSEETSISLKQDEIMYLKVCGSAKLYWPLYFLLLAAVLASFIYKGHEADRPQWFREAQLVLIAPFILYSLFYLSVGRKKYFTIKEDLDNVFAK